MRAQRAAWIIGGACFVVLALYLASTIGDLPARVPMQYDAHNRPTWYATPSHFYAWFSVLWLGVDALLGGLSVALRRERAAALVLACAFAFVNFTFLLVFHLTYTQATGGGIFALSPNQTVFLILPVTFVGVGLAVYAAVRGRLGPRPS